MKKVLLCLFLCLAVLLSACQPQQPEPVLPGQCQNHVDEDNNGYCDVCVAYVLVEVDLYGVNDLHGKLPDADNQPGVDEMTTYFKNARATNDHVVLLSVGDMWQGRSESNLTQGLIITDWMNEVGFDAMVLGNHEYDWGEDAIEANDALAQFPFLAINIYERKTNEQVSYCQNSVMLTRGDVQIGVIGAMGDCYSSISSEQTKDIYFKTGSELTGLVKKEADKLRAEGADFIVYIIHDGFGDTSSGTVDSRKLKSYYDTALSDGYVDLVFEAHTHQRYSFQDEYGVWHLQGGGDNKGITHAEIAINTANGNTQVNTADALSNGVYARLDSDPLVEKLLDKYAEQIAPAVEVVGVSSQYVSGKAARQLIADLYYEVGLERWGDQYDISLGGGFISIRDPGSIPKGDITYGLLQGLFPFDNQLVLCSVSGKNLQEKFFETDHYAYYISYGEYGRNLKKNIDPNGTYYIVVDSYTSTYKPNGLTEIERYDEGVYARDLLADYIAAGGLE